MDNNNEIEEKNSTQADVESTSLSEKKMEIASQRIRSLSHIKLKI